MANTGIPDYICPQCKKGNCLEEYDEDYDCVNCGKNGYGSHSYCNKCKNEYCDPCCRKAADNAKRGLSRMTAEKRREKQRIQSESREHDRAERQRIEAQQRAERQRREQERMIAAQREEMQRIAAEKAEKERAEKERNDKLFDDFKKRLNIDSQQVQVQQSVVDSQLNAMKAEIERLTKKLESFESDSKQSPNAALAVDKDNKPLSYTVMHWFITKYCEMPTYLPNFASDGMNAMDSRILFHIDADALKNDFKIKSFHIQPMLIAIENLKADWIALQFFLNECKRVNLSRCATIAQNKGIFGWDALAFVVTDDQQLADIFGANRQSKPMQYLWNVILKFKQTGQRPTVDVDNAAAAAAPALETEGTMTDTKSLH